MIELDSNLFNEVKHAEILLEDLIGLDEKTAFLLVCK